MGGNARNVPEPAPTDDDSWEADAGGWPSVQVRRLPDRPVPQPSRRRSLLDVAWVALAVLGLLAAAGAAIWYLKVRPAPLATTLPVPRVIGVREQFAVAELTEAGFAVRAVEQPGNAKAGIVFAQRPSAQTVTKRGATVTIRVANGQKP